jgi:hypothetical protein
MKEPYRRKIMDSHLAFFRMPLLSVEPGRDFVTQEYPVNIGTFEQDWTANEEKNTWQEATAPL